MSLDLTPGTATDGSYTAYELLRQDGIVQSRQGSGTWVAGARPHHAVADAADALACAALGPPGRVIDLATLAAPLALRSVIDTLRAEDLDVLDAARKRKKAPGRRLTHILRGRDTGGPLVAPSGGDGRLRVLAAGPILTAPGGYPIPIFGRVLLQRAKGSSTTAGRAVIHGTRPPGPGFLSYS